MNIESVMSRNVTMIAPDVPPQAIAEKMRDLDIGAMPVTENDRLVGMVTDRDIVVRGLADGRDFSSMTARDLMSENVRYCFADQPVEEVLQNMREEQIRRLPVLDRDKRLVGIVSLGDLAASAPTEESGEALRGISTDSVGGEAA